MAVPSTVIVKVDVAVASAGGVTEVGENVAVTPVGMPVIDRPTAELKPLTEVTVMVEVPEFPWTIVRLFGEADTEKSGASVIVRSILTVCVKEALVPVTVSV